MQVGCAGTTSRLLGVIGAPSTPRVRHMNADVLTQQQLSVVLREEAWVRRGMALESGLPVQV